MENINKIIRNKIKLLNESNNTFEDIFNIIHSNKDKIFCELTDGYRIKKITYSEMKEQAIKMACYFKNKLKGIKENSFIGLMMENSPLWVSSFWGLLMSGYKPMLLNVRLGVKLNQNVIDILDIKKVFSDKEYDLNCEVINLNNETINENYEINQKFNWANEIALSTSATTLNVKICVYTGLDISYQMKNTKRIVKDNSMIKKHYKGSLKIMAFLPFYHVFGLIATYFWFSFFGRTIVFLKDYANDTITKTARKHKVTHIFAVPMVWNTICKTILREVSLKDGKTQKKFYKGIKLSNKLQNICPKFGLWFAKKAMTEVQQKAFGNSIKFMITGGGYIPAQTLEIINGIGYPLYNGYGMSEIGITSVELRKKSKYRLLGTIGKPFESVEYKVENENLFVKGKSICSKIITKDNEIAINHDEWFKTNDLTKQDKKGYYYILGRNDDVVISSNGEKINPDLIEKNISFMNIQRFCVLGLEENNVNKLTLVLEIPNNVSILKKQKIMKEIEDNIEVFKKSGFNIEKIFLTTDKIAADTAIKVSRSILIKKIRDKDVILTSLNDFKNNNNVNDDIINEEIYNDVIEVFSEVLGTNKESIESNAHFIFDLGGSSLEYLTLLIKLKEKFEMDFNFKEDEQCYTVYDIVKYILKRGK